MLRCLFSRWLLPKLWLMAFASLVNSAEPTLTWTELPPLPDAVGFAGPYVGVDAGALIVAGGANFPDKMPWEGGTKVWHDRVFVLESPTGSWQVAGRLPQPLGYGVSLSTEQGTVCLGGSDSQQHFAECFRLQWKEGRLNQTPLPPLPRPCANFCGARMGNTIYVAGGIETPHDTTPLKTFWSLDLSEKQAAWKELQPWPGPPRMLATAAVLEGAFYLISGTDLSADADGKPVRHYLRDVYRYDPVSGWTRLADLPRPAVAAPSPAPVTDSGLLWILGGDDGALVNFQPPQQHPGFPRSVLKYHVTSGTWSESGAMPNAHVTTSLTHWNGQFIMPTGEVRPGVRSPAVWSFQVTK